MEETSQIMWIALMPQGSWKDSWYPWNAVSFPRR